MRILLLLSFCAILFIGCKEQHSQKHDLSGKERPVSEDFKNHWHQGTAEITSYSLQQERYGEMREGIAVLIYVTEDFLPKVQVKADNPSDTSIPVLKLNSTKNFITGIYPYSMMSSVFYPIYVDEHALKVSSSVQEWCGHVYAQINNRNNFEITSHSYFEGEGDEQFNLEKTWLEDEFWTLLRIDPLQLPTGNLQVIPSLEYTRLRHKPIRAEEATAVLNMKDSLGSYSLNYPQAERSVTIYFEKNFPFTIEKWEEKIGENTSTATKKEQIQSAYWEKNQNKDVVLRDLLSIE